MHKVTVITGEDGYCSVIEQFKGKPRQVINAGSRRVDQRFAHNVLRKLEHDSRYTVKDDGGVLEYTREG